MTGIIERKIQSFDNFDWSVVSIKNHAEESISGENEFFFYCYPMSIILISGGVGVGKTHLAKAFSKRYLNQRWLDDDYLKELPCGDKRDKYKSMVQFITTRGLYDVFFNLQPHIPRDERIEANNEYRYMIRAEIIILDDLGSEKSTEAEIFKQGFKELLEKYRGRLIITTNLGPVSLSQRYGEKVYSRLNENAVFLFVKAEDHRKKLLGEKR